MKLVKFFTNGLLGILLIGVMVSTSFAYQDLLTPGFIKNFTYYNKYYDGYVTLNNGKYSKPYSTVLGGTRMYFSTNVGIVKYLIAKTNYNQPVAAVVLYYNDTSGNMAFYQLYVFFQEGNKIYQMTPVDLGGGINFQFIKFFPDRNGGKFAIVYYAIGPNDPMCCPSEYTEKIIQVN